MDLLSHIATLLRPDFAQEASAGFPRLARIPCTSIVKFLDYFEALAPAGREPLLDVLARLGAMKFLPPPLIGREYQELRTSNRDLPIESSVANISQHFSGIQSAKSFSLRKLSPSRKSSHLLARVCILARSR